MISNRLKLIFDPCAELAILFFLIDQFTGIAQDLGAYSSLYLVACESCYYPGPGVTWTWVCS